MADEILSFAEMGEIIEQAKAEIVRLRAVNERQRKALKETDCLLEEVREYLTDHHDTVDGDDGSPRPNRAMQLSTWADETAAMVESALRFSEVAQ